MRFNNTSKTLTAVNINSRKVLVKIFNSQGRLVHKVQLMAKSIKTIPLALANGVYMLDVSIYGKKLFAQRFVIF